MPTPRTPWGRYSEAVVLARPGEMVRLELVCRNADSCDSRPAIFTLSWGYHPPHDSSPGLRITKLRLTRPDGTLQQPYAILAPGEELQAFLEISLAAEQEGNGYITPSLFLARHPKTGDFRVDYFDIEGPCVAVGYDYWTARGFAYPTQPPS